MIKWHMKKTRQRMKDRKKLKHSISCILLLISAVFTTISFAAEKLLFTSVEGSYIQKISESVLKVAYAKLGIEFNTAWLSPKRALLISSKGESDGEISRISTVAKNYPDLIQIEIPVNYLEGMAFTINNNININKWDDLKPYRVGLHKGVLFSEDNTKGMNIQFVNSFSALFQLLIKDRVDVIISPRSVGLYEIAKQNLKGVVINEPPLTHLNLFHYLHKRHDKLAIRLEAVLQQMEENGEIKRIRSTYIQNTKH